MEKKHVEHLRELAKAIGQLDECSNVSYNIEAFTIDVDFSSLRNDTFNFVSDHCRIFQVECTSWYILPVKKNYGLLHLCFDVVS